MNKSVARWFRKKRKSKDCNSIKGEKNMNPERTKMRKHKEERRKGKQE